MIKIGNIKETKNVFVEYDLYIPIDIKIGERDNVSESILYWRIGDFETTLVEIGIEKNNKEIRSITLVLRHVDIQRNIPIYCCRFLV